MTGDPPHLAAALRALAAQVETDALDPAALVGALEVLRVHALQAALVPPVPAAPPAPGPSRALTIAEVRQRTGMSKTWLYRRARAGRLPFASKIPGTNRIRWDEASLARWLGRRHRGN